MSIFVPNPTAFSTIPNYASDPFVSGLELTVLSLTTFRINPGAARALTNDFILQYPSFGTNQPGTITVDVTKIGLNGCYPKPLNASILPFNTAFGVYIVGDSTGGQTNGVSNSVGIIVATGDNFLPPGYNSYRRIGFIYISGPEALYGPLGTIYPWVQSGSSMDRLYALQSSRVVISGGTSTTFAPVSLSTQNRMVPPKLGIDCQFTVRFQAASAGDDFQLSYNGVGGFQALGGSVVTLVQSEASFRTPCGLNPSTSEAVIYYQVSPGAFIQINLIGFVDNLSNTLF